MKKIIFFICVLFLSSVYVSAQTDIKGVVYDSENNDPLIGASVLIKGTSQGIITNRDGTFQLKAKPTDVLIFKYLGFKDQEVAVGNQTYIEVRMLSDGVLLQEAVVTTALGIKRDPRALGYAISSIRGEDMIKAGITSRSGHSSYSRRPDGRYENQHSRRTRLGKYFGDSSLICSGRRTCL